MEHLVIGKLVELLEGSGVGLNRTTELAVGSIGRRDVVNNLELVLEVVVDGDRVVLLLLRLLNLTRTTGGIGGLGVLGSVLLVLGLSYLNGLNLLRRRVSTPSAPLAAVVRPGMLSGLAIIAAVGRRSATSTSTAFGATASAASATVSALVAGTVNTTVVTVVAGTTGGLTDVLLRSADTGTLDRESTDRASGATGLRLLLLLRRLGDLLGYLSLLGTSIEALVVRTRQQIERVSRHRFRLQTSFTLNDPRSDYCLSIST
jgi:hypothetical protein